jgi:lipopolysaccharide/colanic/teichoic acid biosynthesis glycosyltransferase
VLLIPVFAIVAILIRLDSKGPIFFCQKRFGLNKRQFWLYKFRTMTVDAEERLKEIEHLNEKDGAVFKIKKDPRITRLGAFLRMSSIDELPQLLNVVIGHMSLVGPRPLSLRDGSRLEETWQKRRFSVRPGMTCLWQISGRSNLSFEQWMKLDLEYIDAWSLQLDFEILAKTIPAVMTARGAV